MPYTALVGLQWGDEGKGKVCDWLAAQNDGVVRFQGGANAGHTVVVDGEHFVLHLLPTGILREGVVGLIGPGVAVDPDTLLEEVRLVEKYSGPLEGRLFVDPRAHLVLPVHKAEDRWLSERLGTTARGIGPCYRDRHQRVGVRVGDILDPQALERSLTEALRFSNVVLGGLYGKPPFSKAELLIWTRRFTGELAKFIGDVPKFLWENEDKKILLEGAQGTLLDVDFGTYPFVTSSHTIAGAASVGLGIPPWKINRVIGVAKAYNTRVGKGPFPTELKDEIGQFLRERGKEFGATTGRPRRCGWLDLVALRYAVRLNGVHELVLTKLDVLTGLREVKVAVAYEIDGQRTEDFPAEAHALWRAEPVYVTLDGWKTLGPELSPEAREFISLIEDYTGVRISFVSVGPDRKDMVEL